MHYFMTMLWMSTAVCLFYSTQHLLGFLTACVQQEAWHHYYVCQLMMAISQKLGSSSTRFLIPQHLFSTCLHQQIAQALLHNSWLARGQDLMYKTLYLCQIYWQLICQIMSHDQTPSQGYEQNDDFGQRSSKITLHRNSGGIYGH